jgi:hypothetical protein
VILEEHGKRALESRHPQKPMFERVISEQIQFYPTFFFFPARRFVGTTSLFSNQMLSVFFSLSASFGAEMKVSFVIPEMTMVMIVLIEVEFY